MGQELPSIVVERATPYTYDLAHLSATDPNPLLLSSQLLSKSSFQRNEYLKSVARDGTQQLLTNLLTSSQTTIVTASDSLTMLLPPCDTADLTPRWKPLPKPKEPTKWEQFARKKGIGKYGGNLKGGAALEERRKNAVYNEETGEWEKKHGYKGKAMREGQGDWLVELDDKQTKTEAAYDAASGKSIRGEAKREKMERLRRQERKARSNAKNKGRDKV